MPSPRFISWSAVSSLPQADRISLQDQQTANREHITRHGGHIVAELTVPGESRDIVLFEDACRRIEAYAQLREHIDRRSFDVLICLNRSRLGRTLALVETIVELCRRAGVLVYETENPPPSLDGPTGNIDGLLLGAIKSATAQNEITQFKYRHQSGMIGRAMRGDFPGRLPWGYRYEYDSAGQRRIVIDQDAAAVIRLALIDLYLHGGKTPHLVALDLNRRGYKTADGAKWSKSLVRRRLLDAWKYAGFVELNKDSARPFVRADGNHPGILSRDEAEAIENEMQRRGSMRRPATMHRFSMAVYCAECGERMQATTNHRHATLKDGTERTYTHRYMRCPTKHQRRYIKDVKIMRALAAVVDLLQDEAARHDMQTDDAPELDTTAEMERLRSQMDRIQTAIRRADDAYVDGTLDAERYRRQIDRLHAQMAAYESDMAAVQDAEVQERQRLQRSERIDDVAQYGMDMLNHSDVALANAWIRRHFRIWAQDNEIVQIELL